MRGLTWAALGFGTINAALFLAIAVREDTWSLAVDFPHGLAALWLFSVLGAHWALQGVDVKQGARGEVPRLLMRGAIAGSVVGAAVAAVMFLMFPLAIAIGAVLGLAAGLLCAALDLIVLSVFRALWNS